MSNDDQPTDKDTTLPPQASPDDTTNWEDRPFIAPDGKVHIENDTSTVTKPVKARLVIKQNNAEPIRKRKIRLVMPKNKD
jgi:hypothetical protein